MKGTDSVGICRCRGGNRAVGLIPQHEESAGTSTPTLMPMSVVRNDFQKSSGSLVLWQRRTDALAPRRSFRRCDLLHEENAYVGYFHGPRYSRRNNPLASASPGIVSVAPSQAMLRPNFIDNIPNKLRFVAW
ncbi:hypothetical protein Poly24_24580 [Rosistilla carotiformis]|uniref:Uncharacterized protein n=1 Tax=Rosistilla carotiformis TaxID=2528017 RepID=A0A518JT86_9BACT|nr:hypothetical protein Poly24_24580 [Rosistilla carotiformis]